MASLVMKNFLSRAGPKHYMRNDPSDRPIQTNGTHRRVIRELFALDVFGPRTAIGRELLSYLTCLHTTTFMLLSLFSLVGTIRLEI